VYLFAFIFGAAAALDAPVRQTFVGELVGDEHLPNAVALNSTSFFAGQMIGPALAGLVMAKIGTGWAFLLNGLSFGAVLLSMYLLRLHELRTSARASRGSGGFIEGLRYVWTRPDLRSIVIMLLLIGTFGFNFPIFISTMAVKVFHTDARGFGFLSSVMSVGTISGALLAGVREKPQFGTLFLGTGVFGIGCTLAALSPGYWWFAAALAVIGVAALTVTNATNSMMQLSTTPTMRGRVMATRVGVALGGTAIGAPIVGWVANRFGPRWSLGIGAISAFLATIVAGLMMGKPVAAPSASEARLSR
jgi:MFS family permease